MKKYIIVEIIPTSRKKETGDIIQLSALKLNDLELIDRFDYRLNEDKIIYKQFLDVINYDKDAFTYKDTTTEILDCFTKWVEDYQILILDNDYTNNYLIDIKNKKKSITSLLGLEYHDRVVDEIIDKYNLEPSNYIVDLLYEALIYEKNKKN